MRFSLFLFILGVIFFTMGFVNYTSPKCEKGVEVKYVPRSVFDEIEKNEAINIYNEM